MQGNLLKNHYLSERGDGTVILMCGLSLLLVAFFAVLNSLSIKDKKKERLALGSFIGSLGILPRGTSTGEGKHILLSSAPILDPAHDLASKGISLEVVYDLIRSSQAKKGFQVITIKKSKKGLNISLSSQSFFTSGTADLRPEMLPLLDKISALIKDSSCDVLIKGHTDNIPITSNRYGSNWELSANRAMNFLRYFVRQGIPLSRLEAAGYGEYDPLLPNDTTEHRALNRRVEIQLVQSENMDTTPMQDKDEGLNIQGFLFKMRNITKK